jgi:hypothetical protein
MTADLHSLKNKNDIVGGTAAAAKRAANLLLNLIEQAVRAEGKVPK